MTEKQKVISRCELFERVWSTPMVKLADEYGISDVGLAKICKRMEIPRPPCGYWQKLKAGKIQTKPKLKPLSKNGVEQVVVRPVSTITTYVHTVRWAT